MLPESDPRIDTSRQTVERLDAIFEQNQIWCAAHDLRPYFAVGNNLLAVQAIATWDVSVHSVGRGIRKPQTQRSASTATMPPNRPNGRGGGGACPGCHLREGAKGHRGRLVATFKLPVHQEGLPSAFP